MTKHDELNEGEILRRDIAERVLGFHVEKIKPEWYPIDVYLFFRPGNPLVEYSLDARTCNAIMRRNGVDEKDGNAPSLPFYADELDAAWEVVEAMREKGWRCTIECLAAGESPFMFAAFHTKEQLAPAGHTALQRTVPLAICLAALKAVSPLSERVSKDGSDQC